MATLFNKQRILLLLSTLFLAVSQSFSQIQVNVFLDPRFTLKLNDIESLDLSYVNVSISNVGSRTYNVTLYSELTGNNGVKINTTLKPKPTGEALVLNPGEMRSLQGADLEDLFRGSKLNLNGLDINKIAQTGNIPEGIYKLCVQAYDNDNLEPLSELDFGCSGDITIQSAEPPQIITVNGSDCGDDIIGALQLNTMFISWTPTVVIGATQPQYEVRIYEILNQTVVSDNQVFSNQNPIAILNTSAPTVVFNPNDYGMMNNTRYIFRIQAIDPTGFDSYRNNGFSASCQFTLKNSEYLDPVLDPVSNYSQNLYYPFSGDTLPFEWIPIISEISPNNGRLSEVMTTTQMTFIGMPFELPEILTFDNSELSIQNNNNRYSLVTHRFEPQDHNISGKMFHFSVLHALSSEGTLLPQGAADQGHFTMGMGKPQINGIRQRGSRMDEKEITFIPSLPPRRLLPRDRESLIFNSTQNSNLQIRVYQKLAVEISRIANFLNPERIEFIDFDHTYDLGTVSEQEILTDLYSQQTLNINLPDSGIYFMRLAWLSDPDDTTSFSFSWSDIEMVNRDGIGISLCLGVDSFTGVRVGATVCIAGGIPITITELDSQNASNQGWTGSGIVEIPLWGERFKIDFTDMVVGIGGLVTDGSAEATHARPDLVPQDMTVQEGQTFIASSSNRQILFDEQANQEADSAGNTLPYMLNTGIGGAKLYLWKLVLNKENSSVFMYYQIPTANDTIELASLSDNTDLSCSNDGLLRFNLVSDIEIPLPGSETNKLILGQNDSDPTYVQLSCSGLFESGQISGNIILDKELFEPSEGQNAGQEFQIPFLTSLDANGNFIGAISLPKFHPGGLEYIEVDSTTFVFDFSKTANYSDLPPPNNTLGNTYEGFYAKEIVCRVDRIFDNPGGNQTATTQIIADQISISEVDGFNTRIQANNIIPWSVNYSWGGWRYSIDTFMIEFEHGVLTDGYSKGYIKTPLDTGNHRSEMQLNFSKDGITGQFELGTNIPFSAMKADLTITQTIATLGYTRNNGMEVSLDLDADFTINVGLDGQYSLDKIYARGRFEDIHLSNNSNNAFNIGNVVVDRFKVYQYEMALTERGSQQLAEENNNNSSNNNGGQNSSNSPNNNSNNNSSNNTSNNNSNNSGNNNSGNNNNGNNPTPPASGVQFLTENEPGGWKRYYLRFAGDFSVQDYLEVRGAGRIGIKVKSDGEIRPLPPEIERFGASGSIGPMDLSGELVFYENHTTYGTGLGGEISCDMDMMGADINAAVEFKCGKKSNFNYWYLKGMATIPAAIPIPIGPAPVIGINGFGLEFGNNVEFNNNNVIPKNSSGVFGGNIDFVSLPDMGMTYKLRGGFRASFNSSTFAINNFSIFGQFALMNSSFPPSNNRAQTGEFFNGSCTMTYDVQNHIFSANANAYISVAGGLIKGVGPNSRAGEIDILFSSQDWHIMVGKPNWNDRVGLSIGYPGIAALSTRGYFMMGTNLPNTEFPDAVVNIFQSEQIHLPQQIQIVSGVSHGASLDVSTGKQEFLIFYGQFDLVVGYDIAFGLTEGCAGGQQIGINNWYASGAMYAALQGSVGLYVDIWCYEGDINIASINAAAVITGGLPNPSYLQGAIAGRYSVLKGLVKGRFNFEFHIGEKCEPVYAEIETPVNTMQLIEDVLPANQSAEVPITTGAAAVFRFNHNESFNIEVPVPGSSTETTIRTFRANHDLIVYKKAVRGATYTQVSSNQYETKNSWDGDFYTKQIEFIGFLESGRSYKIKAKSFFEERKNGVWGRAKNKNNQNIPIQTKEHVFTTTVAPTIQPFFIQSQFPEPNRSFVYTNQITGKMNFVRRTGGLFVSTATSLTNIVLNKQISFERPQPVKYLIRYTDIEENSYAYSGINYSPSSTSITFNTRNLDVGKLYKLEIIRVHNANSFLDNYLSDLNSPVFYSADIINNGMQNSTQNISQGFIARRQTNIQQMRGGNTMETTEYNGIDLESLGGNILERMINSFQDVMYTTYFGTSRHSNLSAKIQSIDLQRTSLLNFPNGRMMLISAGSEPLSDYDFNSQNNQLVKIKPTSSNEYLTKINEFYSIVNDLLSQGFIQPAHVSNFYHFNTRNSRLTPATGENTWDYLIPLNSSSIVNANTSNPGYWVTRMKQENIILKQPETGSKFDRIDQDLQSFKSLITDIVQQRLPNAANQPNDPRRINYAALAYNGSLWNQLFTVAAIQKIEPALGGAYNWTVTFQHQENAFNSVFPNNALPTQTASFTIRNPAAATPSKSNNNSNSWGNTSNQINKQRNSNKP